MIERRGFITLLCGAAACPFAARAQQPKRMRRIGVLAPFPATVFAPFFSELRQLGFIEGQNLAIDRRGFDARYDQLSAIAAEIMKSGPEAILCGGDAAIRAAQIATSNVPVVAITDDMVGAGLVRSLARPGGNTTGVSILAADLDGKRQEVLLQFVPGIRRLAALSDAQNIVPAQLQALLDAARALGVELSIHRVERKEDIGAAIAGAKAEGAEALNVLASPLLHGNRHTILVRTAELHLPAIYQWPETAQEGGLLAYGPRFTEVFGGPFLQSRRIQLALLSARYAVPTAYGAREYAEIGGLMSYGANLNEAHRQAGIYAGRILKGAKPADLPVMQSTKFELVINLAAAGALGIEVPPTLLARADEVIE